LVIGFIDHSTSRNHSRADSRTTNHSTLNLLSVLSLVFIIRFPVTDLLQCDCNFKYLSNYSTCAVFNSQIESSWHSVIPSPAASLNPICNCLSSDSSPDNLLFGTFHLRLTGHSTGTILTSNKLSLHVKVKVTLRLTVSQ
jgi:hypothetical protein